MDAACRGTERSRSARPATDSGAAQPDPLPGGVLSRLARADRWRRQGRVCAAERWMRSAAAAARRREDGAVAWRIDIELIGSLLRRDRFAEAGRYLRRLLRLTRDGGDEDAVRLLFIDVLVGQGRFAMARACAARLAADTGRRRGQVPSGLPGRVAELDFWEGRWSSGGTPPPGPDDPGDPDELGWRGLCAWADGRTGAAASLAARLGRRGRVDSSNTYWFTLLRTLLAEASGLGDLRTRAVAMLEYGRREADALPRRRQRLAAVTAARAFLSLRDARNVQEALGLLRAAEGPGPEGVAAACLGTLARRGGTDAPARLRLGRRAVPGVRVLSSGSPRMRLLESLTDLLTVIEEADDDVGLLAGACRWLGRFGRRTRVALVSGDRSALLAADGWQPQDLRGEIASILSGSSPDARLDGAAARTTGFAVPVPRRTAPIGFVVVGGDCVGQPLLQPAAQAVAVLCGPTLRARLEVIRAARQARLVIPEIIGDSPLLAAVREAVTRAASAPFPVLIEGESGTGKELVARALHRLGPRRERRLCAVNCAALTEELVEAELFGHARGAFTGAIGPRTGLFEEAHGGTLFLDEVTELSPRAQAKLLRVLQEGEIRRVGENQPRPIDARVVAACNVPLTEAVAAGRFRDDLRFRLAVIRIRMPPLRERLEDVPALAQVFWRRAAAEGGTRAVLGDDALARLVRHTWPGNVRELQNVVSALVVTAPPHGRVRARHVEPLVSGSTGTPEMPGVRLVAARQAFERRLILSALARHGGRRAAAAAELGLTRQGLTKALRRLGLDAGGEAAGVA